MQHLKSERVRTTTRKNCYSVWKTFNQFFVRLDVKPNNWEDRLSLFVTYLVHQKYKSQTVKSYISAIRGVLALEKIKLNEDKFLLASLTQACKLKNDHIRARFPIYRDLLAIIIKKTKDHFETLNQPYLAMLYCTVFVTMYFGLFRVSEISSGEHPVRVRDVYIRGNKNKILFLLRSSKTHGKGSKPQLVKISSKNNDKLLKKTKGHGSHLCLYTLLRNFIARRPRYHSLSEPFFIFRDYQPLKPVHVRTILKTVLTLANFQSHLFNTHSFRIGRSSDLLKLGVPVNTIKKLGRWKSNIVYNYL